MIARIRARRQARAARDEHEAQQAVNAFKYMAPARDDTALMSAWRGITYTPPFVTSVVTIPFPTIKQHDPLTDPLPAQDAATPIFDALACPAVHPDGSACERYTRRPHREHRHAPDVDVMARRVVRWRVTA